MSKQIYIDSNGNEVQVSGTVNTADMMPMSGNDSTKVSEAIGDLSDLTTSDTSSLVGAVNEVNNTKQNKIKFSDFTGTTDSAGNIALSGVDTNSIILSVWATNTYPTNPTASGTSWYIKCLKNPADADASKSVHIYFAYI